MSIILLLRCTSRESRCTADAMLLHMLRQCARQSTQPVHPDNTGASTGPPAPPDSVSVIVTVRPFLLHLHMRLEKMMKRCVQHRVPHSQTMCVHYGQHPDTPAVNTDLNFATFSTLMVPVLVCSGQTRAQFVVTVNSVSHNGAVSSTQTRVVDLSARESPLPEPKGL